MAGENRNAAVDLEFGDGTHRFRLAMGELEELQEKTDIGPFALLNRLISGEWRVGDVSETLRIGLVGGGMKPPAALALVRRYVHEVPDWLGNASLARLVIMAALAGAPEEQPLKKGRAPRAAKKASNSRTAASPSAPSTPPPPRSA